MECEIYNEISELKVKKVESEDDTFDWFEVCEE